MKFNGTENYVATEDLQMAVNAAIALQRPLLLKGEPGTGKTLLAEQVANALDLELFQWHVKSTTKAQQGLYEYASEVDFDIGWSDKANRQCRFFEIDCSTNCLLCTMGLFSL